MRDEYYGDTRDFWKWTVALRESGSDRKIFHVAMLQPPPRRPRRMPDGVNEGVWNFFAKEWQCLDAESPSCSRIVGLSSEIRLFSQPFANRNRSDYFKEVASALAGRPWDDRYAVLLDPETGIGGSNPSRRHLSPHDVEAVWSAMRVGDVLLIYQHNAHVKKERWIAEKRQMLADTAGISDRSLIRTYPHSDVCYFVLEK
jgi:hypothetical protein